MPDRKWATQLPEDEPEARDVTVPQTRRGGVEDVEHFERSREEQEERRMSRLMTSMKPTKAKRRR